MTEVIRRFNDAGMAELTRRLQLLRDGRDAAIDNSLLLDSRWSSQVTPAAKVERRRLLTKREAGQYLSERTRPLRDAVGEHDVGLWSWLAAWHWDSICPLQESGHRRVLNLFHYVYGYGFSTTQNQRRHLVAVAVRLYELAPASNLLLETPFSTLPAVVKEVMGRLHLTRIRNLPELLDVLYWDVKNKRQKPGAVSPTVVAPGDLMHRLPARVKQLEMTYDLVDLTSDQLLNLLGDEFRQWADSSSGPRRSTAAKRQAKFFPPPPPPGVSDRPAT